MKILILICLLLASLLFVSAETQTLSPEYDKVLKVFDSLGMPDIWGKKFILFNTGETWKTGSKFGFYYSQGWVLAESKDEITIFDIGFQKDTFSRSYSLPEDWDDLKEDHPRDHPLPRFYKSLDFQKECDAVIRAGVQTYSFKSGVIEVPIDPISQSTMWNTVEPALYGYLALKLREENQGSKLLDLAKKSFHNWKDTMFGNSTIDSFNRFSGSHLEKVSSLDAFLILAIIAKLRMEAILDANEGVSFSTLLKKWKRIAYQCPDSVFTEEAKKMVSFYETYIEEGKKWREPEEIELGQMDASEKVAYWMYKLRDWASYMTHGKWGSYPCIFFKHKSLHMKPHVPEELLKLGKAVIPELINHIDDKRPTRCTGYWLFHAPYSFYILSYGDCCKDIFERMTGVSLIEEEFSRSPLSRGDLASRAKKKAMDWWKENKDMHLNE